MASSNDNPWADQQTTHQQSQPGVHSNPSPNPWQLSGSTQQQQHQFSDSQQQPWSQQQEQPSQMHQYSAPPGPPPPAQQQQQQQRAPDELARLVPESERGEQREALEHFESSKRALSQDDQAIERLTHDFPTIDSALVAAIYSDSRDMGASREMLIELSEQMKADGR